MIEAAIITACALADRIRGGWRPWRTDFLPPVSQGTNLFRADWLNIAIGFAAKFGYGLLLAALLGLPWQWWSAMGVLWWLGEKPGWGYPMGQIALGIDGHALAHPNAKPEWWQIGALRELPWTSLAVRGLMWSLPVLPIAYWYPQVVALAAMAFAMPAGEFIHLRMRGLPEPFRGDFWRGLIIGALCAAA